MYMHTLRRCNGGHWSKISWGISAWSARHWQITIFGIIEFNNCFTIRSLSSFFNEYLSFCHRYAKVIARRRKHGFVYAWADCYLQANTIRWHCAWLQVTWWTLCQWKGGKICIWMIIMSFTYFQIKVSTKVQGFNLHSYQCFISYGSGVLCLLFSILHG